MHSVHNKCVECVCFLLEIDAKLRFLVSGFALIVVGFLFFLCCVTLMHTLMC